ncbi:MAG: C39 family peptidase [Candidatus Uhrbacteria bacterium]|nr:C39 family peptidase [Candidatus Uhrbacteria bacterium]
MKKRDWFIVAIIVLLAIGTFVYFDRVQILEFAREQKREVLPEAMGYEEVETKTIPVSTKPAATKTTQPSVSVKKIAEELNLAVPFTSQAPTGNWAEPYQDSCEEASVLMAHEYYAGNKSKVIDPVSAETSLQEIVALENKLFGYYIDTTAAQTAQFAEKEYGYAKSELILNPTVIQIKEYLNKGEPVLVPAAAQLLKNPYFTPPGPVYHMLVIRGYTKDNKFITNDPGTKHGEAYLYSFDTILNAMHDWDAKDILSGKKVILILHPKK